MSFSLKTLLAPLLAVAVISCTQSEVESTVRAGIGNACGPADEREIWLRTSDNDPVACPSQASSTGLRIRLNQSVSYGIDSLKAGTYAGTALDCRTLPSCPQYSVTVTFTEIQDTKIKGSFQLKDGDQNVGKRVPFTADVCHDQPLCG